MGTCLRLAHIRGGFGSVLVGIKSDMIFHTLTRVGFGAGLGFGMSNLPSVSLHYILIGKVFFFQLKHY